MLLVSADTANQNLMALIYTMEVIYYKITLSLIFIKIFLVKEASCFQIQLPFQKAWLTLYDFVRQEKEVDVYTICVHLSSMTKKRQL